MPQHRLLALSLAVATARTAAAAPDPFEWAGIFATPEDMYYWSAEKVGGRYADPSIRFVLLPATGADQATLESFRAAGSAAIQGVCTPVDGSGTLTPANATCLRLVFDDSAHLTLFKINTSAVSNVAIFSEHFPVEFERNSHYLKDVAGQDIEPGGELPKAANPPKPWGVAIAAAIVVNLMTLLGVCFLVPFFAQLVKKHPGVVHTAANAFGGGAILAAGFFLMMYEATHLIKPANSTESVQVGLWGAAILLGFLTPYLIHIVISLVMSEHEPAPPTASESTTSKEVAAVTLQVTGMEATLDNSRAVRVRGGILIGDFMHNFADGIFMGVGFRLCGDGFGWAITAATVGHEIAQEIADYLVLTDPMQGNLNPARALLLNFLSGTSVLLGVLVLLAQDTVDDVSTGMLLAYGGGVYIQIGAAECMARVGDAAKTPQLMLIALLCFITGAAAIGTVLIKHEHCSPGGVYAH